MDLNVVSTSQRSSLLQCERRWYWEYGLGVRQSKLAAHYRFGTLWHKLMELVWGTSGISQAIAGHSDDDLWTAHSFDGEGRSLPSLQRAVSDWLDEWADTASLGDEDDDALSTEDAAKLAYDMAARYVSTWLAPGSKDRRMRVVQMERRHGMPLPTGRGNPSPVDRYEGTADMLLHDPVDDTWILHEHKTTKGRAVDRERELAIDPQAVGYVALMIHAGVIPEGANVEIRYDIASKQSPRTPDLVQGPPMKGVTFKGESPKNRVSRAACRTTPSMFKEALLGTKQIASMDQDVPSEYADRWSDIVNMQHGLWFHRFTRWVSAKDVREVLSEARMDARRISTLRRRVGDGPDQFSRNWNACMAPGRSCSMLPLCRTGFDPLHDDEEWTALRSLGFVRT